MRPKQYATSPAVVELDGPFTHRMVHARGIRLHAAVAGNPHDPLVVLIHGTFGGWFDFREVIAPLAAKGFHVAAVDMRGYGMSDKPPATPGDETRIATGDIAGVIAALGHDKAALVGHDTGGTVAWACAAQYPDRVTALVSISAVHPTDLRAAVWSRPWDFIPMITRIVVGRMPSGLLSRLTSLRPKVWRRELLLNTTGDFHRTQKFQDVLALRVKAAGIGNAMPHIVHNSRLLTPKLVSFEQEARVQCPTLLIHPPQSLWAHVTRRAHARVDAPVETTHVAGAKNLPHIEKPKRLARLLAGYLHRVF